MKGLTFCIIVYTITFFWFGMWVQKRSDNMQLQKFENDAFTDGCQKCAAFERITCFQDKLQGVESSPPKIKQ